MIQENGLSSAPVHGIVRLPPPYYDEDGITIYCGDCLEILQKEQSTAEAYWGWVKRFIDYCKGNQVGKRTVAEKPFKLRVVG